MSLKLINLLVLTCTYIAGTNATQRAMYPGSRLQMKAQLTCYMSQERRQCDSIDTCTQANLDEVKEKLEGLYNVVYMMKHAFYGMNLSCSAANLSPTDSVYGSTQQLLSNTTSVYKYSSLIAMYLYNLADVFNYMHYGFLFLEGPYDRQLAVFNCTSAAYNDLHNITTLGMCGDEEVGEGGLVSIFDRPSRDSSFTQLEKYRNTVKSYCLLYEFCHAIKRFYRLVGHTSLNRPCSNRQIRWR